MVKILPKHIIGVVDRDVHSSPENRSPQLTEEFLRIGKGGIESSLHELDSRLTGLTAKEVAERQRRYGLNVVAHEKLPPWWVRLLQTFITPFTLILVALGIASLFTDVILAAPGTRDYTKIVILSAMILLSTGLKFWQEYRSQKAALALQAMVQNHTLVTRRWGQGTKDELLSQPGDQRAVPLAQLVPGDIVDLTAGDMVPADIRLLSSKDLFVSQSALTGESMPVEKYATLSEISDQTERAEEKAALNPLELGTLCFMGTNVVTGSAVGVVVATGARTYFGSMARSVAGSRTMTSFDKGVSSVSWLLIRFILVMVPIVFVLNVYTKHDWHEALFFALAVAVGLTPEMLPMIVTANLAKGSIRMSRKKVIVKKLNAIQNFGAMDVLCTDKTGTLTENRVVLMRYLDATGAENSHVLELALLNSYFQTGLRNLMDLAIIAKLDELKPETSDWRTYKKVDEIPFDFDRRRMSVIVQKPTGGDILVCKGAVEEILALCTHVEERGKVVTLTDRIRHQVASLTKDMNHDGLRVIAIGYRPIADKKNFYKISDEQDLVLAGYVGFLDPPKASAKTAIRMLQDHGISIKIITGDNEIVTNRICQEVALTGGETLLGGEIDGLSDSELANRAETVRVFAKTDPLQKERIIAALRSSGHTVGYMGDGINDAAAMRAADVSVSVDDAVDIAKEAADIILLENDLLVLDNGVMEGRTVFGNIMKYIKMTASSNFGNVFSVLIASAVLPFLPMLALQILIQNLLYDFSQISLPWDRTDEDFLRVPRKWEAKGILRFMICMGPTSSVFDIATFAIMWYVFGANSVAHQSLFQSGWFVEGLLSQTLVVHMLRTEKIPFIQSRAAKPVLFGTAAVMIAGMLIPFTVIGHRVGLQALPEAYFVWLFGILLAYSCLAQIVKVWYVKRYKAWL